MNKRLRELRKALGLTQGEFGKILGITTSGVSDIESGRRNVTEQHLIMLSNYKEKPIDVNWIRTGEGEMFLPVLEEDETALYVSELLEDEGDNPLYTIIKEVMHTYSELSPKSQEVIRDAAEKLLENLRKTDREG